MFIWGCIGDLCHLAVVDPCHIFWGVVCSARNVCLQFESVSFPIGNDTSALYMCLLLYVKLIQCSGVPQIYGQLEEWGTSATGICACFYM